MDSRNQQLIQEYYLLSLVIVSETVFSKLLQVLEVRFTFISFTIRHQALPFHPFLQISTLIDSSSKDSYHSSYFKYLVAYLQAFLLGASMAFFIVIN